MRKRGTGTESNVKLRLMKVAAARVLNVWYLGGAAEALELGVEIKAERVMFWVSGQVPAVAISERENVRPL